MAKVTGAGGDFGSPQPASQTNSHGGSPWRSDGSAYSSDYHPGTLPESTFPPNLNVGGSGSVSYNPDKLMQVARAMRDELDTLNGPKGALVELRGNPNVNIFPPGQPNQSLLPTAAAFSTNATNATTGVTKFYDDLSFAYDTVIRNINATVSSYNDADQATQQAANNVDA
ncbi:MAG: hypothetical protein JO345_20440 [Streptosporangiaceae bacterium]|nr:hypothetical protein [Streptosporangiaceae bacterium]